MTNPDELSSPVEIYDQYFGPALFTPWAERLVQQARPDSGQRILDLACGPGIVTEVLATAIAGDGSIAAVDISPAMLDVARHKDLDSVTWTEGSADSIPFSSNEFDMAYCAHGFQYFPDPVNSATEIHRVLKPGGQLAISVWASADDHPLYRAVFQSVSDRLNVPFEDVARPFSFGDPSRLETVLNSAGFRDVRTFSESMEAVFSSPESWLRLTVQGAAAAIPAFGEMSESERGGVVPGVVDDVETMYRSHVDGSNVLVPSRIHGAVGIA